MSPRSNRKPVLGQWSTSKIHVTSMSCTLEPATLSRDTGQQIACFDRCQIVRWMSNIKEVTGKPRLHVPVNLLLRVWRHLARLRRRRRGRAYAPTSNTTSHDNHEKIHWWVSLDFHIRDAYGAPLGGPSGRRSSAIMAHIPWWLSQWKLSNCIIQRSSF